MTAPKDDGVIARPSWATPERQRANVDPTTLITIQVHLKLRNLDAAIAELEAVSDPDSAQYGQYLTSEEFESKYSPTEADIAAVTSHLVWQGLKVAYVPRNRVFVAATGTADQVQRMFSTTLAYYEVGPGDLRRAPVQAAAMPAPLLANASGVIGLSTSRIRPLSAGRKRHLAASQTTSPVCADYLGQYFNTTVGPPYGGGYPNPTPLRPCGLTPPHLRHAYGLADAIESGNDGRGVKIAIIDPGRSPTLLSDAQTFVTQFDPKHPLRTSQITLIDAPSGGDPPIVLDPSTASLWYLEQLLDVEWAHSVAPGAEIVYVGATTLSNEDMVAAVNDVVQNNLASIVSNSWYLDVETAADSDRSLLDPILIQAGLKGIGFYFGSGDEGDNQCGVNCNYPGDGSISVLYPASSPYVTSVGGTSLYLNANGLPAYETGWETGDSVLSGHGANQTWVPGPPGLFFFGAGGGPSHIYPQPKYQQGIVPVTLAGSLPARVMPDVAMLADADSGVEMGYTDPLVGGYVVYAIGGTSLATPLFAATVALTEQRAGHRIGFANPKFYKHALAAFRDITPTQTPQSIAGVVGGWTDTEDPPNLQVMRPDGSIVPHTLHSAPGFDNVTGLGVPDGENFLKAVAGE